MVPDVVDALAANDVLRFLPELREYARSTCRQQNSAAHADDVVQEVLLRAWTAAAGSRKPEAGSRGSTHSGASWLCGIARNVVRESRRRANDGAVLFTDLSREQSDIMEVAEGSRPAAHLETVEADRGLAVAWGNLTSPEREILGMRFLDGRSVPEIARMQKHNLEGTKSRLRRALESLRSLLPAIPCEGR